MTPKQKARALRGYVRAQSTEKLYERYKETAKSSIAYKIGNPREAATEILKTMKVYEEYIKLLEEDLKKTIKEKNRTIRRQAQKIRVLEEKLLATYKRYKIGELRITGEQGQISHVKDIKTTPVPKAVTTVKTLLQDAKEKMKENEKHVAQFYAQAKAKRLASSRGDDPAEALGKKSHAGKDAYEQILVALEKNKNYYMHPNRRNALMASPNFRAKFKEYFVSKGLTDQELQDIWNTAFEKKEDLFVALTQPLDFSNVS